MKKINELVTRTEKPEHKAKRRAVTFGSFKRAEEKQIAERKEREHQAELARIAENARIQRAIADEEARVIKEENTRKRNELITKKLSNAFGTKTDVNGAFTLTATNPNATIYAVYNSISSYDTSTNSTPTAGILSATPDASVISPASTLLVNNSNLTVQQLAKSLGLEGIDLLNFNPYAAGVNSTQALNVEKVSHQIQNVINSTQASISLSTDTSNITPEIQKELLNMGFKIVSSSSNNPFSTILLHKSSFSK